MVCKIIWLIALLETLLAFRGINGSEDYDVAAFSSPGSTTNDVLPAAPPCIQLEGSMSGIEFNQSNNKTRPSQCFQRTPSRGKTKRRTPKRGKNNLHFEVKAFVKYLNYLDGRLDLLEEEFWTLGDDLQDMGELLDGCLQCLRKEVNSNKGMILSLYDQMNDD